MTNYSIATPKVCVIATRNPGKAEEFLALLRELPIEWRLAADYPSFPVGLEETGATYAENARIKGEVCAQFTGFPALGDDSGLEVDALDGDPGVRTARFGGPGLNQRERIALLLERLKGLPLGARTARFRCALALAMPEGGPTQIVEGVCEGLIALAPAGEGGFGYDPIFLLPALGKTLAQLSPEEKSRVSHRALAVQAARPILLDILLP